MWPSVTRQTGCRALGRRILRPDSAITVRSGHINESKQGRKQARQCAVWLAFHVRVQVGALRSVSRFTHEGCELSNQTENKHLREPEGKRNCWNYTSIHHQEGPQVFWLKLSNRTLELQVILLYNLQPNVSL